MGKEKITETKYYGFYFNGYNWILEAVGLNGKVREIDISTSQKHIVEKCGMLNTELAAIHEAQSKEKKKTVDPFVELPEFKKVLSYMRVKHSFKNKSKEADLVRDVYDYLKERITIVG